MRREEKNDETVSQFVVPQDDFYFEGEIHSLDESVTPPRNTRIQARPNTDLIRRRSLELHNQELSSRDRQQFLQSHRQSEAHIDR